jgi:hypothetical protein
MKYLRMSRRRNNARYSGANAREAVERIVLRVMIGFSLLATVADATGWLDKLAPGRTSSSITLGILSTIIVFLLLERRSAPAIEHIRTTVIRLDEENRRQRDDRYGGVVKTHNDFTDSVFNGHIRYARNSVTIFNTWAPNLAAFDRELRDALGRGVEVRILLLFPKSPAARLRDEALRARQRQQTKPKENVRQGVYGCFRILEGIFGEVGSKQSCLRVRVYNSLPSISVYRADEHYLVGFFPHGRLAIEAPWFEVEGRATTLGEVAQQELDIVWDIGQEVNMTNWRSCLEGMQF